MKLAQGKKTAQWQGFPAFQAGTLIYRSLHEQPEVSLGIPPTASKDPWGSQGPSVGIPGLDHDQSKGGHASPRLRNSCKKLK